MNEEEVAAQLAERTVEPPVKAEPEQPTILKPEPKEDEAFHDNLPLETTLDKLKFLDYFEISSLSRRSAEVDTQLNRIIDWARDEAKSSDYTDILRIIDSQERVMGIKLKDNRLTKLSQFVTINQQRKRLLEQERSLYA